MFSKLAYLFMATTILSTQAKKFPGLYRIVNPTSGDWARNFPGPGHQGPWLSLITMTTQFSSIYQVWNISQYEEGYRIHNYGSGNSAFALDHEGDFIQGFSDGMTKWSIESAGQDLYRIHYPSHDLVWTVQSEDKTLTLQPAQGQDTQIFRFDGPF